MRPNALRRAPLPRNAAGLGGFQRLAGGKRKGQPRITAPLFKSEPGGFAALLAPYPNLPGWNLSISHFFQGHRFSSPGK